jgi:hypothetical protein
MVNHRLRYLECFPAYSVVFTERELRLLRQQITFCGRPHELKIVEQVGHRTYRYTIGKPIGG